MNILISINFKYIIPAKVMLKSLSINLKKAFNVYLLYSDLKRKEIERFSKYCEKECNAKLYPMKMNLSEFFGGGESCN